MDKKEWLDHLYYEVGKQTTNFRVTTARMDDGEPKFSKWVTYLKAQETEFIHKANQRELLKNEIVLDMDKGSLEETITKLKLEGYKFYAFKTSEGRAKQIHLYFNELARLSKRKRQEIRDFFIKKFNCDPQLASDNHMIPIEYETHWKTGKRKELVEEMPGINYLEGILIELKEKKEKEKKEQKKFFLESGAMIMIDKYIDNVNQFYELHPFFYDKSNMFWIWNDIDKRYTIVDDVDMMNLLDNILGFGGQTVSSSLKSNYLEAFKRVGRNHIPKNPPKRWIQFKDKAISLRSGNIYDITPDYFFTNPIPWKIGETDKTPTMDKLITEWVGGEYKPTIYELIGYSCLADYPIHLIFCFVGTGRNGKSKCIEMLNKFLGIENVCSTELDLLLDSRFESFKLYKKLVCCMGETNFGVINKTSLLKKLTGQDLIGFEFKNKKPFDDYNYAKIVISSNSLPTTDDTSEGFYRRWLIIDFPNTFPEGKDILQTIPDQEYEALANKVSKILPKLLEQAEFTNQGTIETRKIKYTLASNPLSFFIQNACCKDHNNFMRYSELYASYQLYLSKTKKRAISYKEFSKNLAMEGIEIQRTTKQIEDEYVNDRFILGLNMKKNWQKECLMTDMLDMTTISLKFPICKTEWESGHNRHKGHKPIRPTTTELLLFIQEDQERNKKGYDMQTFANKYGEDTMQQLLQSGDVYERHSGFLWRLD